MDVDAFVGSSAQTERKRHLKQTAQPPDIESQGGPRGGKGLHGGGKQLASWAALWP